MRVIRNRKLLPTHVSVSTDKTPAEREHLTKLRAELGQLNAVDPNVQYTIRYVRGVPKIINASSSDHSSASKN